MNLYYNWTQLLQQNPLFTLLVDAQAQSTQIYPQETRTITGLQLHSPSSKTHTRRRKEASTRYKPQMGGTTVAMPRYRVAAARAQSLRDGIPPTYACQQKLHALYFTCASDTRPTEHGAPLHCVSVLLEV